jgi:hypothetical protein
VGRCGVPRGEAVTFGSGEWHPKVKQDADTPLGSDFDAHPANLVLTAVYDVLQELTPAQFVYIQTRREE